MLFTIPNMFVAVEPKPNEAPIIITQIPNEIWNLLQLTENVYYSFAHSPKKQFSQHRPCEHRKYIHIMGNKCELGFRHKFDAITHMSDLAKKEITWQEISPLWDVLHAN